MSEKSPLKTECMSLDDYEKSKRPEYCDHVYASTTAHRHDSQNAIIGVTAHCKCGHVFVDDVIAGISEDITVIKCYDDPVISKLINIQPCPFCGEKPNVFSVPDPRFKSSGWVIECKNMGCIFKRSTPNQSLSNLLDDWNTRK